MVTDAWDVAHIAVVVTDMERAMEDYARGLGVEWAPVFDMPPGTVAGSDVHADGVSFEGLTAVLPRTQIGPAQMELIHAVPGSPASLVWGCPNGRDYVHHVAFYVQDVAAENERLLALGWEREWYVDVDGPLRMAYYRRPDSTRIELVDVAIKAAAGERRKSVLAR